MRRLFTAAESGLSRAQIRWGEQRGRWMRLERNVYAEGSHPPTALDRPRAQALAFGPARSTVAGVLYGLDAVALGGRPTRRRPLSPERIVDVQGVLCADGLQTMLDLAAVLDDDTWEQALESALRKRLTTIDGLQALPRLPGVARRVLDRRPDGAPPTESLLETLAVQLPRLVPGLEDAVRQHVVLNAHGDFVARVDLCWPELGLFVELDGQHHKGQPVYDARRQTAVTAATGWLCARFTWDEIVRTPRGTARRLAELVEQARRRSLAA